MGGFSEEERMHFKEVIFENVMYSVRGLIGAVTKNGMELEGKNKVCF